MELSCVLLILLLFPTCLVEGTRTSSIITADVSSADDVITPSSLLSRTGGILTRRWDSRATGMPAGSFWPLGADFGLQPRFDQRRGIGMKSRTRALSSRKAIKSKKSTSSKGSTKQSEPSSNDPKSSTSTSTSSSGSVTGGLTYHGGPILINPIKLYIVWYGQWADTDKAVIRDFVASFGEGAAPVSAKDKVGSRGNVGAGKGSAEEAPGVPSVGDWWGVTQQYTGWRGMGPTRQISLGSEVSVASSGGLSVGKTEGLISRAIEGAGEGRGEGLLPFDVDGLYVVLSSSGVTQDGFCTDRCGYHSYLSLNTSLSSSSSPSGSSSSSNSTSSSRSSSSTSPSGSSSSSNNTSSSRSSSSSSPSGTSTTSTTSTTSNRSVKGGGSTGSASRIPYVWVGDASQQCLGKCNFPFHPLDVTPAAYQRTVSPPNGKAGIDSLIGVLAHEIAEAAASPFLTGWYSGSASTPTELADLCSTTFGPAAYPGSPGEVILDSSGKGYNVVGAYGRRFLLPWLWSNADKSCRF